MAVFISYARDDQPAVATLRRHIEQSDREIWLDENLTGGQDWWDTILSRIRECDIFLYALSLSSLRSRACEAELEYAQALGRPILPVMVASVEVKLAPPSVADRQIVDYRTPTPATPVPAETYLSLRKALDEMPAPGELPDPLPDPPPVPTTYLHREWEQINDEDLTFAQQAALVAKLRSLLEGDDRPVAIELLRKLRARPDVAQQVARDIDDLLVEVVEVEPPPQPPPPPRLSARFHPNELRSRRAARFALEARNDGEKGVTATLALTKERGPLSLQVDPRTMDVGPNATETAAVRVTPRTPLVVGRRREHPVRVGIATTGFQPVVVEATFVQEPWIRPWVAIVGPVLVALLVAVLLILPSPADRYADAVLRDAPLAFWRFDDSGPEAADSSSQGGHDGSYRGGVTPGESGPFRGATAASFDGVTGWVSVPPMTLAGNFTIEAWVLIEGEVSAEDHVVGRERCGENLLFFVEKLTMFDPPGTTEEECENRPRSEGSGGVNNRVASGHVAVPGEWTHWVVVRSEDAVAIYRNGEPDSECPGDTTPSGACQLPQVEPFLITAIGQGNGRFLGGSLAEVAVYDRALRSQAVKAHFDAVR
jgi:hypothetical protein